MTDLGATNARLANSITSVDLADLVLLDLIFAVLIAAVGAALFLLAGLAERRRELATIEAIGAEPRQLRALVVGEATVIGLSGLLIGVLSGGVVGFTLLQIMAGLFDPPADFPTVPIPALLERRSRWSWGLRRPCSWPTGPCLDCGCSRCCGSADRRSGRQRELRLLGSLFQQDPRRALRAHELVSELRELDALVCLAPGAVQVDHLGSPAWARQILTGLRWCQSAAPL